jgi:hypothetical protein
MHNGVDMVDRAGTPIVAPEAGEILEARQSNAPGGGFGWYVKLKGDSEHIFAHLIANSFRVKKGDKVTQGQALGLMGTTGASTGVHLHWEVRTAGKLVDPMTLIPDTPKGFKAWTQNRHDGTAKAFIRNAALGAKVRVRHNGESVFNRTFRHGDGTLEKTVTLIPGRNRISIEVDGKEVKGATYTLRPNRLRRL